MHRNPPAQVVDRLADDRQPQPGALALDRAGVLGAEELLEQVRHRLIRDADAGIRHLDQRFLARAV